jgi:ribonuclease BN (tRNA processing enzyme)
MTVRVQFVGTGDAFGSGGRFQTCILVDGSQTRFSMDFGMTSLTALKQQDIKHTSIDVILITHLHGDHCGGVPFLLMDSMLAAKRSHPLTIAGPKKTESCIVKMCDAMLPGMEVMQPKFDIEYVELEVGEPNQIRDLVVTPRHVRHTWQTNPTALRVEVDNKVVSYTGDGSYTEELAKVGHDADLLIAESYFYQKPIKWHLNYYDIVAHKEDFRAKRTILTHMHEEMLVQAENVPEETAYDGLVMEL